MRICTHGSSSILAILGGAMFLVLPVAFLSGTVSINYAILGGPACTSGAPSPTNPHCLIAIVPMPGEMALYLILLGGVGIFLGLLALVLGPSPRTGVAVGFASSLGLMVFLFGMSISRILETFFPDPSVFLLVSELSIVVMVGAAVDFVYDVLRARMSLPLTIAEANAHQ